MNRSRTKKRVIKNYFLNLIYQVFAILTPLITTPYISRVFGAENIGIYSFTLSIATYFGIIGSLGFPLYGQREVAFCSDDRAARSKTFFEILTCQLVFTLIATVLFSCYVFFFVNEHQSIYFAQLFGIIGTSFATSWFYAGMENFKAIVFKNVLVKLISIVCIFVFVKTEDDLFLYAALIGVANILGNLVILLDVKRYVDFRFAKVNISTLLKHIKPAFVLGIPFYITSIYAVIDRSMIGLLSSNYSEVGFYEQSQKIITFSMALVTSLGTVLMPRLASEAGHGQQAAESTLTFGVIITMLVGFPISFGLLAVGNMVPEWFFGDGFETAGTLILIFSPLIIVMGLSNLLSNQFLVATKKEKSLIALIGISLILNCILNMLLIPMYGSIGAGVATVISEMVKLVLSALIAGKFINSRKFWISFVKYFLTSFVMFFVVVFTRITVFNRNTPFNVFCLTAIGFASYLFLLFFIGDDVVLSGLKNIYKKLSRKQ